MTYGNKKCIYTYHQNHVHVYFVNITCKSIIDNNVYMEFSVLLTLFLSEQMTFCICLEAILWCVRNSFMLCYNLFILQSV